MVAKRANTANLPLNLFFRADPVYLFIPGGGNGGIDRMRDGQNHKYLRVMRAASGIHSLSR